MQNCISGPPFAFGVIAEGLIMIRSGKEADVKDIALGRSGASMIYAAIGILALAGSLPAPLG